MDEIAKTTVMLEAALPRTEMSGEMPETGRRVFSSINFLFAYLQEPPVGDDETVPGPNLQRFPPVLSLMFFPYTSLP